jgi:hypothetical protein
MPGRQNRYDERRDSLFDETRFEEGGLIQA